jgi:hypothetical protein
LAHGRLVDVPQSVSVLIFAVVFGLSVRPS